MGKRKFKIGDKVVISKNYQSRYNDIKTVGEVVDNATISDRVSYLVKFEGKNFKRWYKSFELDHAPKSMCEQSEQNPDNADTAHTSKFHVGDKVFLTESAKRWFQERGFVISNIHKKHIVGSVTEGKDIVFYKLEDCSDFVFFDKDLQSEPSPNFKTGDLVIFTPEAKMWLEQNGYCYPNSSDYIDPEATYVITSVSGNKILLKGLFGVWASPDDLLHAGRNDSNKEYDRLKENEYRSRLKSNWNEICNRYLEVFCEKHDFNYEPDMWIGSDPGTIIEISDMFVSMENIRYDVDNDVPVDKFSAWYWKNLDLSELGVEHWMNYPSYCKGAPDEWTEERMNRLRESKKRLEEARESFRQTLEEEVEKNKSKSKSF